VQGRQSWNGCRHRIQVSLDAGKLSLSFVLYAAFCLWFSQTRFGPAEFPFKKEVHRASVDAANILYFDGRGVVTIRCSDYASAAQVPVW
jgi:hypothetical protein